MYQITHTLSSKYALKLEGITSSFYLSAIFSLTTSTDSNLIPFKTCTGTVNDIEKS